MNQKDLMRAGKQLVRHAKRVGATDVIVSLNASVNRAVTVREGIQDGVSLSSGAGFTVTAVVGDKRGSASSTSFATEDIERCANNAVLSAREVSGNVHLRLARQDEWPCGMDELERRTVELDLCDDNPFPTLKELETHALALDKCARGMKGISRSEGSSFDVNGGVQLILLSNGFHVATPFTQYSKSTSVIAENPTEMKSGSHWHVAAHFHDLMSNEECVHRAGEYAVSQLGARSIQTGKMPVMFDKKVSPKLLSMLFSCMSGARVNKKETCLREYLGAQIFREDVQIIERPHLPRMLQSGYFDGDCVKTSPWTLIDKGKLMLWATDIESASKLGHHTSTGHASGSLNLLLCPTTNSRDALIQGIQRGIIVTEIMGHGVNLATGAYSVGAEGFLVEHGEIIRPVNKITIAGNLLEMFKGMVPADDCSDNPYGANAPSCLIESMMVAGT